MFAHGKEQRVRKPKIAALRSKSIGSYLIADIQSTNIRRQLPFFFLCRTIILRLAITAGMGQDN
jgi:hypothetical protein